MNMKRAGISVNGKCLALAAVLGAILLNTAAAVETTTGPPVRMDFEAAAPRSAAPVVEVFEPGPPRRIDFEAQSARSTAPVEQVFESGPPRRIDFEATSPRSSY
jgi:hypothetical protein